MERELASSVVRSFVRPFVDEFGPSKNFVFYPRYFCELLVRFSISSMCQRVLLNLESRRRDLKGMRTTLTHRKISHATNQRHSIENSAAFLSFFLLCLNPDLPSPRNQKNRTNHSFLGFEDLDVVDPTAGSASRGGQGASKGGAGNVDEATRMAAFANFRDFIGMDITSLVTLPVWIMEPYTLLQKVAEIMEYTGALETAVDTEDEFER